MNALVSGRHSFFLWRAPLAKCKSWKVPKEPVYFHIDETKLPPRTKIDQKTIEHLERLSLVDFANKRGIERLEEAIRFADRLSLVDTSGVEALVSVLEDQTLHLRDDVVTEGGNRKIVMSSASVTDESYYVAPPGNIPVEPKATDHLK